jgi:hypothetical protein
VKLGKLSSPVFHFSPLEMLNLVAYFRVVASGMQGTNNLRANFHVVACGMLGTSRTSTLLVVNLEFLSYQD